MRSAALRTDCGIPVSKRAPSIKGLRELAYLEVAAYDEEVDAIPSADLTRLGDGRIDGVEGAVALQTE